MACERAQAHNLTVNLGYDMNHMVMKDLCAMPGHSNLESPTKSDVQGLPKMKRLAVIGNYLWPLKRPML